MCFNLVPCFGVENEAGPLTFVNGLTAAVIKHEVVLNPHLHVLQHIRMVHGLLSSAVAKIKAPLTTSKSARRRD